MSDFVYQGQELDLFARARNWKAYWRSQVEPFLTGLIENNEHLGRPADVLVMKDGSLLVSDDHNGAIYRISYGR